MKKTTVWLMIIAMVICLTGNLQGTKAFAASKGVVNTETLNVREGAGTNYSILTTLARGTEVTILETLSTEWLRVRFKASGTDLEGYVASMYISVSVDKNILAENLQISAKLLSKQTVYKKAKRNANAVTYKKKKVRLQKGCRVTVQGIKKGSGQHWYLLSFTYKKKQLTGYISTDYVKLQSKKKISAYTYKKSNVYTKVGNTKKATCLKKGKNVKIIKEKTVKSKKWFQISYAYGGKTRVGWVLASDVGIRSGKEIIADVPVQVTPTPTPPTDNVILTDAEFEADMVTQGFPESYKPALRRSEERRVGKEC